MGRHMKYSVTMLSALALLTGCGSAIAPDQADGKDCNYAIASAACSPASYCDPGDPSPTNGYLRNHSYGLTGDKTHVVGLCRRKGATGAACLGQDQCTSGQCVHPGASPLGSKGTCQ